MLGAELQLGDLVVLVDYVELGGFLLLLELVNALLGTRLLLEMLLNVFLELLKASIVGTGRTSSTRLGRLGARRLRKRWHLTETRWRCRVQLALGLDHAAELHDFVLQARDDALVLGDLVLHVVRVLCHACLDVLGPVSVL